MVYALQGFSIGLSRAYETGGTRSKAHFPKQEDARLAIILTQLRLVQSVLHMQYGMTGPPVFREMRELFSFLCH